MNTYKPYAQSIRVHTAPLHLDTAVNHMQRSTNPGRQQGSNRHTLRAILHYINRTSCLRDWNSLGRGGWGGQHRISICSTCRDSAASGKNPLCRWGTSCKHVMLVLHRGDHLSVGNGPWWYETCCDGGPGATSTYPLPMESTSFLQTSYMELGPTVPL